MSAIIGLDIGSYAIKVIAGKFVGKVFQVQQALEIPNPVGSLFPTDPGQRQALIAALQKLFTDNKLPLYGIRASLAESQVVTKVVTMPLLSDAELASAIQWQVEQHIPIPLEEMQYEYSVLRRSGKKDAEQTMDVFMVGVKTTVVQGVADLLLDAGIDATTLETDSLAQVRALSPQLSPEENVFLLHIGASESTVVSLRKGQFQAVYSFPIAGLLFSRAIERGVGLDGQRAEEYKRTYGLLANQLEGKVRAALNPALQSFVQEVQKAQRYFGSQAAVPEVVARMYVSGGSVSLPDLLPVLSQSLSLEVVPADLVNPEFFKWIETPANPGRFVIALGLAMKREEG